MSTRRTIANSAWLLMGIFLGAQCSAAVTTSYHIGNSLTHDSQPEAVALLAASRGLEHQVGYHIRSASSLDEILANPDDPTVVTNDFGTYLQALPNNAWDVVTIQPHPNNAPLVTLETDTLSILSFINLARSNPANQETNFYIYQSWPQISSSPYYEKWDAPSPDLPDTQMSRTRDYYQHLIERVRAATDANVYMIPTGEVFYELDVKIRAGKLPGFSSINQFYRDAIHMDFGKGRFVASVTTFSTMLGQYPNELEKPAGTFEPANALNANQTAIILDTIRGVLDQHPYTGIDMPPPLRADFNDDNVVNDVDLQLLNRSLDVVNAFDPSGDKATNGRDFLMWQQNYREVLTGADAADFAVADLNNDGLFTPADLQHWQSSYGLNGGADVDGDGDTDGRDFLAWQRVAPKNPADWNRDFYVDGDDLASWRDTYGFDLITDANGDGMVTAADHDIWLAENGLTWSFPNAIAAPPLASQTSGWQSLGVPEPCSHITAVVGVLTVVAARRKPVRH